MDKKKESQSILGISKATSYTGLQIILNGIDEVRQQEFNAGKTIEVTEEELKQIGNHRWLIKEIENGN